MDFVSRLWSCTFLCVGSTPAHFLIYTKTERRKMPMEDYKKMYYELFNKITDTIENLKKIQQDSEETFITSNDDVTTVADK
jgi:uncharacterized spore protein YtfJ